MGFSPCTKPMCWHANPDEIDAAVLSRPGRYRAVAENLRVKEIVVGEGANTS